MQNVSFFLIGICLLLCLLFYSGCNEQGDKLPPATTEGKNTFGCFVNGELFLPKGPLGQSGLHAEVSSYRDTVSLIIYAGNSADNRVLTFSIYDCPVLQTGKSYDLKNSDFQVQYIDYNDNNTCTYESVEEGYMTLSKFELTENITSGTFEVTIFSKSCNHSVRIKQGRFDTAEIVR